MLFVVRLDLGQQGGPGWTTHYCEFRVACATADVFNRLAVFHAAGLLIGINLGPLLAHVAFYRPDIILTALLGTAMIFVSFSAAALVAKRRHFLYLGGVLGSAISILCSMRMLNFFMGGTLSAGLFAVELYGGLAMFMAYIIFDTQMIIEVRDIFCCCTRVPTHMISN